MGRRAATEDGHVSKGSRELLKYELEKGELPGAVWERPGNEGADQEQREHRERLGERRSRLGTEEHREQPGNKETPGATRGDSRMTAGTAGNHPRVEEVEHVLESRSREVDE